MCTALTKTVVSAITINLNRINWRLLNLHVAHLSSLMFTMFLIGLLRGQANISFFTTIQQATTVDRNTLMMWVLTIIDTSTVIGNLLVPRLILTLGSWTLPILGISILLFCLVRLISLRHHPKQSSSDIDEDC